MDDISSVSRKVLFSGVGITLLSLESHMQDYGKQSTNCTHTNSHTFDASGDPH